MELIHLFKLFFLISASNFLSFALDILYILNSFGVLFPFLSQFFPMRLFGHKLGLLIFIDPGNGFYIDLVLLKGGKVFA